MKEPHIKGKQREHGPARVAVPGGKAVARLQYFETQREIPLSDPVNTAAVAASIAGAVAAPPMDGAAAAYADPVTASPYAQVIMASEALSDAAAGAAATTALAPPLPPGAGLMDAAMNLAMAAAPPATGAGVWRSIGPFRIPNGQTYGTGRTLVSGRVSAIAVDPRNPRHVLAGAAGGGIWETLDDGATWAPRTDTMPTLAIGAIAFDPQDSRTVYAGTGEGNFFFQLGAGLIRSTDGGTTWQVIARDPLRGKGFFDLKVDPLNRQHLMAGVMGSGGTGALYESRDGGLNWTVRRPQITWSISIRPPIHGVQPGAQEIFVACLDGVYQSKDSGVTWTPVALPGAPAQFVRAAVFHAPSNGDVVYVWAAGSPSIADPGGNSGQMPTPYLWRRTTASGAFTPVTKSPKFRTGQAWYDWALGVAPDNPDVVYCADIELHRGEKVGANWRWTVVSAKTVGDSIHPDQHCIAFGTADPNVVYAGSDGGIFRSPDRGERWVSLNAGLCIAEFEYIAQHPQTTDWILGGVQDNGTLRYEGASVWNHVADGDGGACGVNAAQPLTCYHSFYAMALERSTTGGAFGSWSGLPMNVPPAQDYPAGALFYPPMAVQNNFLAKAGIAVFLSSNGGTTWSSHALPAIATTIAISTPTLLYFGVRGGDVVRLDHAGGGGGAWNVTTLGRPRAGYVSDIEIDPNNPQRLWATYSNVDANPHVFRSEDGGRTWNAFSAGLPAAIPVNAIAIDPAHPEHIFAALDQGVYRSSDNGANWTVLGTGLPNALVKDLCLHQPSRRLRAATQSRGVWEIDIDLIP